MTIGVLLINHQPLGQAMLDVSMKTLGVCPLAVQVLDVPLDADPDQLASEAQRMVAALDSGDGVLILTDLCGSTPANIACRLSGRQRVMVVAGLNLPMLMRVFNYPELRLIDIVERALDGGRQGVMLMPGCQEH
ncbi:MAG: PTS sugar transporter subunit IIA [Gammaproteobacteria bacterium]|nr:PTS sugar transporter subunit IIA [Gammaproteobacteria bacterium]